MRQLFSYLGKWCFLSSIICLMALTSVMVWQVQAATNKSCPNGNCQTTGASSDKPVTSLKCNQFTFDASKSSDPDNEYLSFYWDFGDGVTSQEPVVVHSYDKSGDYTVTLEVSDNSGAKCQTSTATQKVRVNIPPFAAFQADEQVCTNQEVTLDASASYDEGNTELSYDWVFGDGTRSDAGKIVKKAYTKGGKYKIGLKVDDNSNMVCSSNSVEKVIYVNEPPVAEAGDAVLYKCVNDEKEMLIEFDASKSADANGDELAYKWDFGDGSTGTGMRVSHRYGELGNYEAKLIVNDNTDLGCGTDVDFVTVKLNRMPTSNAGPDTVACPLEEITFDGSQSYAHIKGTLGYKWTFGDGQKMDGMKVAHAYNKPGKYQATLTVENKLNPVCAPSKDTAMVTVNSIPSVALAKPQPICVGNKVSFDATNAVDPDGDTLEFYWSFGDGNILKTGPRVTHNYAQGGNYRVSVIADDGKGSNCSSATAETAIKVNTPPKADAGPNLSCCVGQEAKFDATGSIDSDGDFLTYTWDFGDGTKAVGATVNHAYQKSGQYKVFLTVDDNSGTPCSKSVAGFVAEVNAQPVPVINIR